jgi:hypothetical protein
MRAIRSRVQAQHEHRCEGAFSSPPTKTRTCRVRASPRTCKLRPSRMRWGPFGTSHLGIRLSAHSVCIWEYFGCSFCSVPNRIKHRWSCPCHLWPPGFAAWYWRGTMVCSRIEVFFSLIYQLCRFKEFAMFGRRDDFPSAAWYRCYLWFPVLVISHGSCSLKCELVLAWCAVPVLVL